MSLYVEIAMPRDHDVSASAILPKVLAELERAGVVNGHRLISWSAVKLDPAYVHITNTAREFAENSCMRLMAQDIFPIWSLRLVDLLFDRR